MNKVSSSTKSTVPYGPLPAVIVTVLAYFAAPIGVVIVAGFVIGLVAYARGLEFQKLAASVQDSTLGQFAVNGGTYLIMIAIIYAFLRVYRIGFKNIGLHRLPKWSDAGIAIVAFLGYFIILALVTSAAKNFIPGLNVEQEQQIGFKSAHGPLLIFVFIALVILPPLVEEIIMRGFLYSGLRRRFKVITAAIITSFLFCIAHLQLGSGAPPLYVAAIDTFILSMFLVGLRERTGSLWASIFTHGLKNCLAFLALFVFHSV